MPLWWCWQTGRDERFSLCAFCNYYAMGAYVFDGQGPDWECPPQRGHYVLCEWCWDHLEGPDVHWMGEPGGEKHWWSNRRVAISNMHKRLILWFPMLDSYLADIIAQGAASEATWGPLQDRQH